MAQLSCISIKRNGASVSIDMASYRQHISYRQQRMLSAYVSKGRGKQLNEKKKKRAANQAAAGSDVSVGSVDAGAVRNDEDRHHQHMGVTSG